MFFQILWVSHPGDYGYTTIKYFDGVRWGETFELLLEIKDQLKLRNENET